MKERTYILAKLTSQHTNKPHYHGPVGQIKGK